MTSDVQHFEEKLREAEERLGVKAGEGIPVYYHSDSYASAIFTGAVVIGLFLLSYHPKFRKIRSSFNLMNFVSNMTESCITMCIFSFFNF